MEDLTFEKACSELEKVVNQLEKGTATLERSLELYEKGTKLAAYCHEKLNKAQLRVEEIQTEPKEEE